MSESEHKNQAIRPRMFGLPGFYPLSGIPEYLAVAIKPHIDAIVSGQVTGNPMEQMSHNPKLLDPPFFVGKIWDNQRIPKGKPG